MVEPRCGARGCGGTKQTRQRKKLLKNRGRLGDWEIKKGGNRAYGMREEAAEEAPKELSRADEKRCAPLNGSARAQNGSERAVTAVGSEVSPASL
jgi:hypothetical protein